jgi:hypothetical protein
MVNSGSYNSRVLSKEEDFAHKKSIVFSTVGGSIAEQRGRKREAGGAQKQHHVQQSVDNAVPPPPPSQHKPLFRHYIPPKNSTNMSLCLDLPTDWNPIVPTGNPESSTNDAVENFIFSS